MYLSLYCKIYYIRIIYSFHCLLFIKNINAIAKILITISQSSYMLRVVHNLPSKHRFTFTHYTCIFNYVLGVTVFFISALILFTTHNFSNNCSYELP